MHFEQVHPPKPSFLSSFPNPHTFPPNPLKIINTTSLIFPPISITQPNQIHSTPYFYFNLEIIWLRSLHLLFLNVIILGLFMFSLQLLVFIFTNDGSNVDYCKVIDQLPSHNAIENMDEITVFNVILLSRKSIGTTFFYLSTH